MNIEDKAALINLASLLELGKDLTCAINAVVSKGISKHLYNSMLFVRKSLELGYQISEILSKKEAEAIPIVVREILKTNLSNRSKGKAINAYLTAPKLDNSNMIAQEFFLLCTFFVISLILFFYFYRVLPVFAEITESVNIEIFYLKPFSSESLSNLIYVKYILFALIFIGFIASTFVYSYFHLHLKESFIFYIWKRPKITSEAIFLLKFIQTLQNSKKIDILYDLKELANPKILSYLHKILSDIVNTVILDSETNSINFNNKTKSSNIKHNLELLPLILSLLNHKIECETELELYYQYLLNKLEFYQNTLANLLSLVINLLFCLTIGVATYLIYNVWVIITQKAIEL